MGRGSGGSVETALNDKLQVYLHAKHNKMLAARPGNR